MKHFFLFFSFVIALTLFSCNDKVGEVLDVQDEQTETEDSIFTYDMYFDSEIIPYDGTTRASMATKWEDGDVVYIHFQGANDAYGQAVYISASKKWSVSCEKELVDASNNSCSVWFGKGINHMDEGYYADHYLIKYSYFSETYITKSGKYTFSNNGIYVNAFMQPSGWRLRFKGTVGTEIQVSVPWWSIINGIFQDWEAFYSGTRTCSLVVGSNGYTDYLVASDSRGGSSNSDITITLNTGESFSRYFDRNSLKEGESGCFTIPTSSDLHGWTKTSGSSTINGHEYVDLGLPSGTLWATCNIGATKPEEYGGYYAWGETEEKDYYDYSTYKHCDGSSKTYHYIGDDIAGTEYDVAHVKWGGTWRMPSSDQIQELIDNCTRIWKTQNGVNGILVTGPNGATVFLPAAGYREDYLVDEGIGYYESSTSFNGTGTYLLRFSSDDWFCSSLWYNYRGYPVRAVCPKSQI